MSGNTNASTPTSVNMTREELHDLVINEQERDEFGFQVFQSPYTQAFFEKAQRDYKLKYNLKQAYEKQEFLRKMRADIKREYLTRKNQLKKLQQDAAVMFREDEMILQEHYSSEFSKSQPRREIDIHASLVSHVTLPRGKSMNVKEFNIEQEFEGLRNLHREYYESDMEATIRQVRDKERKEFLVNHQQEAAAINDLCLWYEQSPPTSPEGEEEVISSAPPHQTRGAFGGCYDEEYSLDEEGNDSSSYDSDYCGVFGYYPREYEWERQAREDEEARAAAEAAEEAARRRREEEMSIEAEEEEAEEEDAGEAEEEDAEEVEPTYDDDIPSVEPKERHASSSAFTATSTNVICAKKKAVSKSNAAAATKARIAKQQRKKQEGKKFVPVQITDNTNRANEVTAILTANKLEINLPKKNLQNASHEAVKRHNQKWNRVNALAKQSGARGTKIATLPDPRPWYNNSTCYSYESD